jgi:peptidoglycan/LPS O-acetylase OafA/YrhL
MGTIRLLLALGVVFTHSYGYLFTGGKLSVQIFYMISGYLMSLILINQKTYQNLFKFYLTRLLRLFPIYWFVALLTLIYFLIKYKLGYEEDFFQTYFDVGLLGSCSLIISNIILFGQDWLMFTGVSDGVFHFVTDFRNSDILVYNGLLIPQAWTLGIELTFYAICPFILKKKNIWVTLLIFSILVRIYLIHIGLGTKDPFSYRFFPSELSLFLLGAFSHQFLLPLYNKYSLLENKLIINGITYFIILFIISFSFLPFNRTLLSLLLISIITLSLPIISKYQRISKIDHWISKFSYPVYISHMLIIILMSDIFIYFQIEKNYNYYFLLISTTLIFSYALDVLINEKVEKIRSRIKKLDN